MAPSFRATHDRAVGDDHHVLTEADVRVSSDVVGAGVMTPQCAVKRAGSDGVAGYRPSVTIENNIAETAYFAATGRYDAPAFDGRRSRQGPAGSGSFWGLDRLADSAVHGYRIPADGLDSFGWYDLISLPAAEPVPVGDYKASYAAFGAIDQDIGHAADTLAVGDVYDSLAV